MKIKVQFTVDIPTKILRYHFGNGGTINRAIVREYFMYGLVDKKRDLEADYYQHTKQ